MKFNVIYADCPWSYRNVRTGYKMNSGSAAKYPVLMVEDLCGLPIEEVADKNSVLFLWATTPMLPEALEVMKAWGFKYKTIITWKKNNIGLGFWFRTCTEHLLLGVRGKVKAFRYQHRNFVEAKVLKHSQKPEIFREVIESAIQKSIRDSKKLELFATTETAGWTCLGYQIDGRNIKDSLKDLINEN